MDHLFVPSSSLSPIFASKQMNNQLKESINHIEIDLFLTMTVGDTITCNSLLPYFFGVSSGGVEYNLVKCVGGDLPGASRRSGSRKNIRPFYPPSIRF